MNKLFESPDVAQVVDTAIGLPSYVPTPSRFVKQKPPIDLIGIGCGLGAVVAWVSYNVGAKLGLADGFRPTDLTLLRFGGAALLFSPFFLRFGARNLAGIGWPRGIALVSLAGPVFGLLVNFGFVHAPLSHGVVLAPAAGILITMLLTRIVGRERIVPGQLVGATILVVGLVVLAGASAAAGPVSGAGGPTSMLVGDAAFFLSGCLWGTFTFLLKRWDLDPLRAAATVGVLSGLAFLPIWLVMTGDALPPVGVWSVALQFVLQGVLGGCLGIVAYAATVRRLGASKAALFPALTPPLAILIGMPLLHEYPGAIQVVGVAIALVGVAFALGLIHRKKPVRLAKEPSA